MLTNSKCCIKHCLFYRIIILTTYGRQMIIRTSCHKVHWYGRYEETGAWAHGHAPGESFCWGEWRARGRDVWVARLPSPTGAGTPGARRSLFAGVDPARLKGSPGVLRPDPLGSWQEQHGEVLEIDVPDDGASDGGASGSESYASVAADEALRFGGDGESDPRPCFGPGDGAADPVTSSVDEAWLAGLVGRHPCHRNPRRVDG